nr:Rpn family recombination-promoting nuclease/putative transposase [Legionella anisa]
MQPRSYINEVRQESEVDVLFKTTIDNKKAYLYFLLEHQSKPDPLMPFRLLKYPVMYTPL